MSFLAARGITRPIMALTGTMGSLANGDHAVEIPGTERGDELGLMAKAVLVFKENMIKAKELAAREAEAQAEREARPLTTENRKRVGTGKGVSVKVKNGGRRNI